MARLMLSLLGPPVIALDNEPVANLTAKMQALLAYLAVEADRPHRREVLAGLLWGEQPEPAAYNNLRQALHRLQVRVHDNREPFLLITPQTVQFNSASDYLLDVAQFTALMSECTRHPHRHQSTCRACAQRLQQAADLYRGPPLSDFSLKDSPGFDEWLLAQRDRLERMALSVWHDLAEYHAQTGDYAAMERAARRQIKTDMFREDAHRQLMRALAWQGQRSAALGHCESLRQTLMQELNVSPEPETLDLRSLIETSTLSSSARPVLRNWPTPSTPFWGRERELTQLAGYLQDPKIRLVVIVAPGGMGKSRLALQSARQEATAFREGACFVPLTGITDPGLIVHAIGDALALALSGPFDPKDQLLNYLQRQELLLVLDGLEQFVSEAQERRGIEVIDEILRACPGISILATSRLPLELREEWILPLDGLTVPNPDALAAVETYSAVKLFQHCAQQVAPNFSIEAHRREVARICELVEGMPLALELAATWVQVVPCAQIAREIESNLAFLSTPLRHLPERHRHLSAVYEGTYNLLSPKERQVLPRLSIFRGGFTREAAERVAGADLALLASLAHKALVRVNASARYDMHELLRQFAEAKLVELPEEHATTLEAHGRYYLSEFMPQCEVDLRNGRQNDAIAKVRDEFHNVRAAWSWGAANARGNLLHQAFLSLALLCDIVGYLREGEEAFREAAKGLDGKCDDIDLAPILTSHGFFCLRRGDYEQAERELERSRKLADPVRHGECIETALPPYCLGILAHQQGEPDRARQLLTESLAIFRKIQDQLWIALTIDYLGEAYRALGEYDQAEGVLREALAIHEQCGDQWGVGRALWAIGCVLVDSGEYAKAYKVLGESLGMLKALGLPHGVALASIQLGRAASGLGNHAQAREFYRSSLESAIESGALPLMVDIVIGLAEAGAAEGSTERAVELAACALRHPMAQKETCGRATRLLATLAQKLSPSVYSAASERGEKMKLEECFAGLRILK